jgi:uncharacterized membrane-anchored protein YhcB (DUF1043 family)
VSQNVQARATPKLLLPIVALAVAMGAGIVIGFVIERSNANSAKADRREQAAKLGQVQADLARAQARESALSRSNEQTTIQVNKLREEVAALQSRLEARTKEFENLDLQVKKLAESTEKVASLGPFKDALDADRTLLLERRKGIPDERPDAIAQWNLIKSVAGRSDASLVSKVDRVTRALPAYYDWVETDFASALEAQLSFLLTGANNFESAVTDFWNSFLLIASNRLEQIARLA